MTIQDYRNSIAAPVSTAEAYDKISRVSEWWASNFEGRARELGDKFTVRFGETFVDFTIAEAVPGKRVVWDVANCYLPWLKDKTEWNGTSVVWDIKSEDGNTTVAMTHRGLTPEVECYEGCEQGWNLYVTKSLLQFLTEGKGTPDSSCSQKE